MYRSASLLAVTLFGATLVWNATAREPGYYGIGRSASEREIAGWDIDVRPDGLGLPEGSGSVMEGEELFLEKCSSCHGVFGEGAGRWPVLTGGFDTLAEARPDKTVGSYWPYATTLWDYIHRAMPFFNPQSLTNSQVYALTAYVLYLNDIIDDDVTLDKTNLADIEMPNRDGFYEDNRPDVQNVACMENCKTADNIAITGDASTMGVTPTAHLQNDDGEAESDQMAVAELDIEQGGKVYNSACAVCHNQGVGGAPKTGDKNAWLKRVEQGMDTLVSHAINGYRGKQGYMPPKGGNSQLDDNEVAAAVAYIVEQSRAEDSKL